MLIHGWISKQFEQVGQNGIKKAQTGNCEANPQNYGRRALLFDSTLEILHTPH